VWESVDKKEWGMGDDVEGVCVRERLLTWCRFLKEGRGEKRSGKLA
jgi:hypothetical protein